MSVRRRLQDNRGEPISLHPSWVLFNKGEAATHGFPCWGNIKQYNGVIGGAQKVSEHVREARDTRDDGKRKSFSPLFVSRFVFANQISPDRPQ